MANSNCVFCNIVNEQEPATILYKDEDIVVFPDIRPAAKHHYLIVPKNHINSAKHLTKEHISLVENLVQQGRRILQEKQADLKDSKFGFHWPPFNSISHLHLHVISPASQMSFISKLIFQEGSPWFVKLHSLNKGTCEHHLIHKLCLQGKHLQLTDWNFFHSN